MCVMVSYTGRVKHELYKTTDSDLYCKYRSSSN